METIASIAMANWECFQPAKLFPGEIQKQKERLGESWNDETAVARYDKNRSGYALLRLVALSPSLVGYEVRLFLPSIEKMFKHHPRDALWGSRIEIR